MTSSSYWAKTIAFAISLIATHSSVYAESLEEMLWNKRVIITFSNTQSNPNRLLLKNHIDKFHCEFKVRHLVHMDLIQGTNEYKQLSQKLSIVGGEFTLILLGKDGEVKLTTASPSLIDIFSLIDSMPMRRREIDNETC